MKTLKLEHHLAELVKKGQKTTTWRLYDDKDISVNDEVKVIDKVDPDNPATWQVFGTIRVNEVIQKRLGDVSGGDYTGQERYESQQKTFELFKKYYGPQVDADTPVKIIRFTFNNSRDSDNDVYETTASLQEANLYADGGSRGNPGPSASGFAILDMNNHVVVKKSTYLGVTTNNQAEYRALKLGLEEALRMRVPAVHVYMDSLLVVNQMLGIFKVKNRDLWPIHAAIKELLPQFKQVSFKHIPRELNKLADSAVNEALDEALKL